jgi:hypothetical protein
MFGLALGVSLLGATLGLELVDRGEVAREESDAIVSELERELTLRRNERPLRFGVDDGGCVRAGRAAAAALDCGKVEALVTLRLVSGIRKHRVVVGLLRRDRAELTFTPVDVARQGAERPELAELARAIDAALVELSPPPATTLPAVIAPAAPAPEGPRLAPWVLTGASVACFAAGLGFGLSSRGARGELEQSFASQAAYDDAVVRYGDRVSTHANVANVLFGVAGASALGAAGLWLFGL